MTGNQAYVTGLAMAITTVGDQLPDEAFMAGT